MHNITEIMRMLPHRYPFLMVDRILEWEKGKYIKAQKNVTINEPQFTGHFPQMPIFPGVYLLEAMAQVGGLVFYESEKAADANYVLMAGIKSVNFARLITPGDVIFLEAKFIRRVGDTFMSEVRAWVDDTEVAKTMITYKIVPNPGMSGGDRL